MGKAGRILIGGGFFTHERLNTESLLRRDKEFSVTKLEKKHLLRKKIKIEEDFVVLFGLKGIERILRKCRMRPDEVMKKTKKFFVASIDPKCPLIIVDDFSSKMRKSYSEPLRKFFFKNFNIKLFLLREYLKGTKYPNNTIPFSLPCNDFTRFFKQSEKKKSDVFFQGNNSNKDRVRLLNKVKKTLKHKVCSFKLMEGGTKNKKDRMPFKKFLKTVADSRFCLSFSGSGYDCYRYQEIASVGSIIASPDYPLAIRNDYENMVSCIKFEDELDLQTKIEGMGVDSVAEMQHNSIERFKKFHTTEVRYAEFKNFLMRLPAHDKKQIILVHFLFDVFGIALDVCDRQFK